MAGPFSLAATTPLLRPSRTHAMVAGVAKIADWCLNGDLEVPCPWRRLCHMPTNRHSWLARGGRASYWRGAISKRELHYPPGRPRLFLAPAQTHHLPFRDEHTTQTRRKARGGEFPLFPPQI